MTFKAVLIKYRRLSQVSGLQRLIYCLPYPPSSCGVRVLLTPHASGCRHMDDANTGWYRATQMRQE